ncbi:MAG: hypothetical protein KDK70_42120 [Myxococcales bacterium]|nr:hypothetical protein [Myxococcales bacterium]
MKRSTTTLVLCFLGLSVCGKASKPAPDDEPRESGRAAPKQHDRETTARQRPPQQESSVISPASALEHFEHELDTAAESLTPFTDGTRDPRSETDTVRSIYEKLYPLDEFLTRYLTDHRDEVSDETRQAIGRAMASVTSLELVLMKPEDPTQPHLLEDFISNTLGALEEIRPILAELEAPADSP